MISFSKSPFLAEANYSPLLGNKTSRVIKRLFINLTPFIPLSFEGEGEDYF